MTNYLDLPTGRDVPNIINAVIEIPKGSSNKYEYDKELNVFKLDRTLYSPVHYPGAYGFIPRTHGEDGDPLDVVVIVEQPTFTGCLIEVRPLGVLIMRDDMGLDHKILAVPVSDPKMREVHGLQHLASHYLAEVDYFFNIYKDLEGKKSDTYGWEDRLVAYQVIEDAVARYEDLKAGRIDRWGNALAGKGGKKVETKKKKKSSIPESLQVAADAQTSALKRKATPPSKG
jgi:inorganic pyrophosphatase